MQEKCHYCGVPAVLEFAKTPMCGECAEKVFNEPEDETPAQDHVEHWQGNSSVGDAT